MFDLKVVDNIVLALLILGALNLGLAAFADVNVIAKLAGENTMLARVVYGLIAAAGLYAISWFVRERQG